MISMKVSEGGRVVIPVEIRKAMGLQDGDTVLWDYQDGQAWLTTRAATLERARQLFQQYCPPAPGCSLADELIAERREEGAQE